MLEILNNLKLIRHDFFSHIIAVMRKYLVEYNCIKLSLNIKLNM